MRDQVCEPGRTFGTGTASIHRSRRRSRISAQDDFPSSRLVGTHMTNDRGRRPPDAKRSIPKLIGAGIAILAGARLLTFILAAAIVGGILLAFEWLQ